MNLMKNNKKDICLAFGDAAASLTLAAAKVVHQRGMTTVLWRLRSSPEKAANFSYVQRICGQWVLDVIDGKPHIVGESADTDVAFFCDIIEFAEHSIDHQDEE